MKLKDVKRGVRVEAKQDIWLHILKGATGTILQADEEEPYVQWDNFTKGHSGGSPTVPASSWSVCRTKLRRLKD